MRGAAAAHAVEAHLAGAGGRDDLAFVGTGGQVGHHVEACREAGDRHLGGVFGECGEQGGAAGGGSFQP
ncbi:hypothetical protein [Streptomyces sp. IBSBF 3136]|uniref:hypothetical protein n=1 Tax=Streptomyces sp. IBSBF 3136 TaxID=2903524 RepID=UPI002FDC0CCB